MMRIKRLASQSKMTGLETFKGQKKAVGHIRPRLWLEALEDRAVPAIVGGVEMGSSTFHQAQSHQLFNAGGFLSGPQAGSARDIALNYVYGHAADLGVTTADLHHSTVTDYYVDADVGTAHLYLQQTFNGLPVVNANINANVTRDGRIINVGGGFISHLSHWEGHPATLPEPTLSAVDAIGAAAWQLNISMTEAPRVTEIQTSANRHTVLTARQASADDIHARLVYMATPDAGVRLGWSFSMRTPNGENWFDLVVDGHDGSLRMIHDLYENFTYQVYQQPLWNPNDGARTILVNPWDTAASPFGWHDNNGVAGAEFNDTRGNNAVAQDDFDNNDSGGARPLASATGDFNFPIDFTQVASANINAAIVNAYYWTNLLHDLHFKYGFTEAAGNFQTTNYSGQGSGGDAVLVDAQDSGAPDNAFMGAPADGSAPRLTLGIWTPANPDRDSDFDSQILSHEFGHGVSTRLTGGPANSNALSALQSSGMGEGWSDFYALTIGQKTSQDKNSATGMFAYLNNQPVSGGGFRRQPYSFNMSTNNQTIALFNGPSGNREVHNVGELWCDVLWDMNWLLIDKYGFDPDLTTGYSAGNGPAGAGNKLSLRLIMDGMKLQPANPSFQQARDAILLADVNLTGGQNQREIWTAFARRGMGASFASGTSSSTVVTPAFDLPVVLSNPGIIEQSLKGVVAANPDSIVLTFSEPMDSGSFSVASDVVSFTGPGGVNLLSQIYGHGWLDSTHLQVNFNSQTAQGNYSLVLGPQIFAADNGSGMDQNCNGAVGELADGFAANFRFDAMQLQVNGVAPVSGAVVLALTTVDITFNESVNFSSLSTNDLKLSQGSVTGVTALSATTARFTVTGPFSGTVYAQLDYGSVLDVNGFPTKQFLASYSITTPTKIWDGGGSDQDWGNLLNWTGNTLPSPSDIVLIPSGFGTIAHTTGGTTIQSLVSYSSFSLTSGTLTLSAGNSVVDAPMSLSGDLAGAGNLTVIDKLTWISGTMSGSGQTFAAGGLDIATGGAFLDQHILRAAGSGAWTAGNIYMDSGAQFIIENGGTLECDFPSTAFYGFYRSTIVGTATVSNMGTFRNKNADSGPISGVGVTFLNTGTVFALAGTMRFADGINSAIYDGTAIGKIEFSGGTFAFQSSNINGAGGVLLEVSNGTFRIDANASVGKMAQSGGEISGSANITATGKFTWSGGTMTGTGQTFAAGGLDIASGSTFLDGRILKAGGTGAWTAGNIYLDSGAQFIIDNNAVLESDFPSTAFYGFYRSTTVGTATVSNMGTFRNKNANSGTVASIGVTFLNAGVVYAQAGTIQFTGGGINAGTFNGTASGTIEINGGTLAFQTSNVGGAGGVLLLVSGGILRIDNNASVGKMAQSGGEISGSANITATGKFTWSGGTMTGTGQTFAAGGLDIASGGTFLDGRILKAGGTGAWTAGNIYMDSGAQLIIDNNAVLECDFPSTAFYGFYRSTAVGTATISNLGILRNKNTNSGVTSAIVFNNTGTVDAQNGTIRLENGGTNSGVFNGLATGRIELSGGTFSFQTAAVQAAGGVTIDILGGGNVQADNAATFAKLTQSGGEISGAADAIVNGVFQWIGGAMIGTGKTFANGTLNIDTNGTPWLNGRELVLNGVGNHLSGNVYADNGAKFTIGSLATLNCNFAPASTYGYYRSTGIGTAQLVVHGTFQKSVATNQAIVNITCNNLGTIHVEAGTATFSDLANSASGTLTGGIYYVKGTLQMAGPVTTLAANLTLDGTASALLDLSASDGIIDLATISSAGSLTLKAGRVLTLNNSLSSAGIILVNAGTQLKTVAGGVSLAGSTSIATVNGTLDPFTTLTVAFGATLKGSGTVLAPTTTSGFSFISPGQSPGILSLTGNVVFNSNSGLNMEILGTDVGTQYDQLKVNGTVNLGGVELNASCGFVPVSGAQFTILENDGADAIVGTFAGLSQSATLILSGQSFTISYIGGTGNDVVLTSAVGDTTAPTITGVFFGSSAWTTAFRTAAGNTTYGYPAQTAAGQLTPMPWSTVNTVYVKFSENVVVASASLGVRGINVVNYSISSFIYDNVNFVAKWVLAGFVDTDRILLDLDGDGGTAVADFAGNKLSGTWTEGVSTFPSSGPAAQDFRYRFVVAVGDADRTGHVRNPDTNLVRANLFIDAGQVGYNIYADIDGNGLTRNADLNAVRSHLFVDPPAGPGPNRPIRGGGARNRDHHVVQVGHHYVASRLVGPDRAGTTSRRMSAKSAVEVVDRLFEVW